MKFKFFAWKAIQDHVGLGREEFEGEFPTIQLAQCVCKKQKPSATFFSNAALLGKFGSSSWVLVTAHIWHLQRWTVLALPLAAPFFFYFSSPVKQTCVQLLK